MDQSCCNCRFWKPENDYGLCRFNAPMPTPISMLWHFTRPEQEGGIDSMPEVAPAAAWPQTESEDWCGKYEHR